MMNRCARKRTRHTSRSQNTYSNESAAAVQSRQRLRPSVAPMSCRHRRTICRCCPLSQASTRDRHHPPPHVAARSILHTHQSRHTRHSDIAGRVVPFRNALRTRRSSTPASLSHCVPGGHAAMSRLPHPHDSVPSVPRTAQLPRPTRGVALRRQHRRLRLGG